MKKLLCIPVVLGVLVAGLAMLGAAASAADSAAGGRVFERRVYIANPGKMEALHARFRDHTNQIFKKHGIEVIGYWTPEDAADTLIYLCVFPSVEAKEKAWAEFKVDPEWLKVKAESEKDGVLVKEIKSTILRATDYSPLK
jgi:hypothetical protein